MKNKLIKITPLGGVGQIGSNSTLIQSSGSNVIIDCGILFPYEDSFDINYLIPDLSVVDIEIDTIVITHGHEDHIGAIRHFIEAFPKADIYAPRFARELILEKLSYLDYSKEIKNLNETLSFIDFEISNFHVNHSIPDTRGLMLTSKSFDLALLFISDFKIDLTNTYEDIFDFDYIKSISTQYSRRVALLDSTNMMSSNLETPSESSIYDDLKKAIQETSGNTFVTTFASNIYRIQTFLNIAKELGRVVIPHGRSMKKYMEIATKVGILEDHGVVRDIDNKAVKKKKIVLTSGSQGEFRGTTRRVVTKQDSRFKLKEDDCYIFSSKAIPGNEKKLALLYNDIVEQNCKLIVHGDYKVHVSGHPGKDDLKKIYECFNPTNAFPIHGESLFLKEHRDFVLRNKLSDEAEMILNGDTILISKKDIKVKESAINEPILIHGNGLMIEREKISQRRKISTQGLVIVSFSKESVSKFKANCEVTLQGLPSSMEDEIKEFKYVVTSILKDLKSKPIDVKVENIRIATRRYFGERLGYRPVAIVHIC